MAACRYSPWRSSPARRVRRRMRLPPSSSRTAASRTGLSPSLARAISTSSPPAVFDQRLDRRQRHRRLHGDPLGPLPMATARSTSTGAGPARSARRSARRWVRPTPSPSSTRRIPTAASIRRRRPCNGTHVAVGPVISHMTPDAIHDMAYATGQVTVTGTGSDTLTFASLDDPGIPYGIVIDAVSMTPTTIQPTLTTTPSSGPGPVDLGTPLSESALLSGTAAGVFAGGTLTFQAFNGDNVLRYGRLHPGGDSARRRDVPAGHGVPAGGAWNVLLEGRLEGDPTTGTLPASSPCGDSTIVSPAPAAGPGAARARRAFPATARTGPRSSRTTTTIRATAARPGHGRSTRSPTQPGPSSCRGRTRACTPGTRSLSASTSS